MRRNKVKVQLTKQIVDQDDVRWKIQVETVKDSTGRNIDVKTTLWCDPDQLHHYLNGLFKNMKHYICEPFSSNIPCFKTPDGVGFYKADIDEWFLSLENACAARDLDNTPF